MVQKYTFRYFWDFAEPKSGMSHERTKSKHGNIVTVGGSGFGVMAVVVGVERGFITREEGAKRLLKVTNFLKNTDRYHGMWSHWYSGETLKTYPFSKYDDGGDIVESSFMAQGLLTAFQYFTKNTIEEKKLRSEIKYLWETMEWDFYTNGQDILFWHWSPNFGWKKQHGIRGYNECLITYVLAASSATHSISAAPYHKGWMGKSDDTFLNYQTYYNISLPLGPKHQLGGPLFFEHYSYLGLDPRALSDKYANYWEQVRRHTLINRAYCIDNPKKHKGYGENFWGLTACDKVPKGYKAHAPGERD
ncbi:MAG: beta-glucosidase, partial [Spirochaetes bacterium]